MTVLSIIAGARDQWHGRYLESLASYKVQYQPSSPEVMFQLSDNGRPQIFRLFRADMASGATSPPNTADVNLDPIADTGAEKFLLPCGLIVLLHPIHWNGVEFVVDKMPVDSLELQQWCSKWLDLDETNPLDEHGLLGAIHSATAPEADGSRVAFSVDFGSAPVNAVDELFDVLHAIGVNVVRVSSPWGYEI